MIGLIRLVASMPLSQNNREKDLKRTKQRLYEIDMELEDILSHYHEMQIKRNVLNNRRLRLERPENEDGS